jgi:hypothetical protein
MKTRKLLILQWGTDGKKPPKEIVPPQWGTKKVQETGREACVYAKSRYHAI